MWPRLGAVAPTVVVELELGRVLEASSGYFRRKVQVHRFRHAALELAECVPGVLVHAPRDDQALAVFPQPLGGRLLVTQLYAGLGILLRDRHVARHDQQRRPCRVCAGDRADHVGKARPLRSGRDRDLTGYADEGVCRMRHRSFVATAVGGDARFRERMDDRVVSGAREQRSDALLLARARKHLRAGHRELVGHRLRGRRRGELRRDENRRSAGSAPGGPTLGGRRQRRGGAESGRRGAGARYRLAQEVTTTDSARFVLRHVLGPCRVLRNSRIVYRSVQAVANMTGPRAPPIGRAGESNSHVGLYPVSIISQGGFRQRDAVVAFVGSAAGRRRLMNLCCRCCEQSRTHLSPNKDASMTRPIAAPRLAASWRSRRSAALHHRYERRAA